MKKLVMLVLLGLAGCVTSSPTKEQPAATHAAPAAKQPQITNSEGHILVPWNYTHPYIGRFAFVQGKVVSAKATKHVCFLNFHRDYRHTFTATIDRDDFDKFSKSPDKLYRGKTVVLHGQLHNERGKPGMSITSPDQVIVVPVDEQDNILSYVRSLYPDVRTPEEISSLREPRVITDTLRIGTYNLLNLFDEYDDPYHSDEVMDPKPRDEMEKVAQRIRTLDADVLALEEVENRFFLERFVHAFLPDMGYDHIVLIEGNNHRGIDCALLSRLPVGRVTSHRHLQFPGSDGKTYRFMRDFLQAEIHAPGDFTFDVFVVHLKSKYGGAEESEPVRQAEATQIRKLVDQILYSRPEAPFVICGDYNDYWDSPSLKIIRGSGQTELTCPGAHLREDGQITYNRERKYWSMIDFIVCSPQMQRRYVDGSYRILHGTVDNSGSDHNPVVATFSIR